VHESAFDPKRTCGISDRRTNFEFDPKNDH
jgi:hypothetical protein